MNSVTPSTRPRMPAATRSLTPAAPLIGSLRRRAPRTSARSGRPRTPAPARSPPRASSRRRRRVAQQLDRPAAHRLHRAHRLEDAVDAVLDHLGEPARPGSPPPARRTPSPPAPRARTLSRLDGQQEEIASPAAASPPSRAGRGTARPPPRPAPAPPARRRPARGRRRPSASVAGIARRIRAKTRTTSFTRFTSRKLETCMIRWWPAGASAVPLPLPGRG